MWVLFTQIKMIKKQIEECKQCDVIIMERSVWANHVFGTMLYENKDMSDNEWFMYLHIFEFVTSIFNVKLDAIIYLKCPVQIAMKRIKQRNRHGENKVTEEYLEQLDRHYDEWINNKKSDIPVETILVPFIQDDTIQRIHKLLPKHIAKL